MGYETDARIHSHTSYQKYTESVSEFLQEHFIQLKNTPFLSVDCHPQLTFCTHTSCSCANAGWKAAGRNASSSQLYSSGNLRQTYQACPLRLSKPPPQPPRAKPNQCCLYFFFTLMGARKRSRILTANTRVSGYSCSLPWSSVNQRTASSRWAGETSVSYSDKKQNKTKNTQGYQQRQPMASSLRASAIVLIYLSYFDGLLRENHHCRACLALLWHLCKLPVATPCVQCLEPANTVAKCLNTRFQHHFIEMKHEQKFTNLLADGRTLNIMIIDNSLNVTHKNLVF